MARLTKADINFLERHRVDPATAFDASGLTLATYSERMRTEGKLVAYGVTRCARGNHSLRTRSGNCVKCFPASIAFQARANAAGYLYVAQSASTQLIKVGFSSDQVDNRLYIANVEGFGGCFDWRKVAVLKSRKAGRLEIDLHRVLSADSVRKTWIRNGALVESREMYQCDYHRVLGALSELTRLSLSNFKRFPASPALDPNSEKLSVPAGTRRGGK